MSTDVENAVAMRQLAEQFRKFNFNLVPLGADKKPVKTGIGSSGQILRYRWMDWQTERQDDTTWKAIRAFRWWVDVHGVAALCGPVSNDLTCIDFDTPKDHNDLLFPFSIVEAFLQSLGLNADYPWLVDTPRGGYHVWLRSALQLDKAKLDRAAIGLPDGYHIEVRYAETYAALPGSLHPNGKQYAWHNDWTGESPAQVDPAQLLTAYNVITVADSKPVIAQSAPHTNGSGTPSPSYAQKALDNECNRLRSTTTGRNNQLNNSALALGQLVGAGLLDQTTVEQELERAARDCGLDEAEIAPTIRSGINKGLLQPRVVTVNEHHDDVFAYEFGFVLETPEPLDLEQLEAPSTTKHHTWPYTVDGGRMIFLKEDKEGEIERHVIADFEVSITEEITDESGNVNLVLTGHGLRRGAFRAEISGTDFGSDIKLLATLTAATGGIDVIYKDMHKHLRPAIGKLTQAGDRPQRTRYYRTGWMDDTFSTFLIPGMDATTLIALPRQVAYSAPASDADLDIALMALRNLIEAMDATLTTPIISALLLPPLLRPAGWGNERVAVFISGRTGSLKTSWTQTAMCLYGQEFANNDNLLKLGEGATRVAIMAYAAHAHDMPLFIDNFKPNTGNGKSDFTNIIHNILEGGDRKRSNRTGALQDSKLIRCIPIITGEDMPMDDAASVARVLRINFAWQHGEANEALTIAQRHSRHLSVLGKAWIDWIAGEGAPVAQLIGDEFPCVRTKWSDYLRQIRTNSANIARVASNLAVNDLTWQIALQHPTLGPLLSTYTAFHMAGLETIACTMANSTIEAMEAYQYRDVLRELVDSGQYILVHRSVGTPANERERDRMLGWQDNEGIYLTPKIALTAVKRLLGPSSLLGVTPKTIHEQMYGLGWIVKRDKTSIERLVSINGSKKRVLHMKPNWFEEDGDSDEDDLGL